LIEFFVGFKVAHGFLIFTVDKKHLATFALDPHFLKAGLKDDIVSSILDYLEGEVNKALAQVWQNLEEGEK